MSVESVGTMGVADADQRLREVITCFMGSPVGVAFHDRTHRITHINDTLAAINGVPIEATIGRTVKDILPSVGPRVEALLEQVWRTGRPVENTEIVGETPAEPGATRYWTCTYFPYRRVDQQIDSVGAIVLEVTENRRAARILAKEKRALEEANRIMMGRENRILELKQEVNALLKELGRPARYTI